MFKAQVQRRNFSLFNRVPYSRIVRSAARDGHESVTIQRVRIRRPFFRKSRLVGAVAVGAAFYAVTRYISIEVEVEKVAEEKSARKPPAGHATIQESGEEDEEEENENEDEEEEDEDEDEGEEEEEEDDDIILFLPTGFSRAKPQTFYKGSDPEWQEFIKLAKDRPRVDKIRGELAVLIRELTKKSPRHVAHLGNIDTSKGKLWIDFKFPDGPPVQYERPGIALTEDLEWRRTTRDVEELHHRRLNKLLYPTDVSNALYQDMKRKAEASWKSLRAYMGLAEKPEPNTVKQVLQKVLAKPPVPTSSAATTTSTTSTTSSTPRTADAQPAAESSSPVGRSARELGFALPDPKALTLDLTHFHHDVRKTFKPYLLPLPRGTLYVIGLIEVYGDRARMTVNVAAAYDLKQGKYISLQAKVWHLSPLRQTPRGGP